MDDGESITIAFNNVTVDDAGMNGFMAETQTRPVADGLTMDEGFENSLPTQVILADQMMILFVCLIPLIQLLTACSSLADRETIVPDDADACDEADGLNAVVFRVITDGSAFSTAGSGMLTVSPSVVEKGTENQDLTLTYTSAVDLAVSLGKHTV